MPNDFNNFVERLQKNIREKELESYSEKILGLFYNPKNWGKPLSEEITAYEEQRKGPKNYLLGIYLKIENDIITKANFITDGCGVMVATGSQTTILIEGRSIEFAVKLKPEDIIKALSGLPNDEIYCAEMAIEILQNIIQKYNNTKKLS